MQGGGRRHPHHMCAGELGPLGRPGLGPREVIPLFTADRLGQVETLLEAAWVCHPWRGFGDGWACLSPAVEDWLQGLEGVPVPHPPLHLLSELAQGSKNGSNIFFAPGGGK